MTIFRPGDGIYSRRFGRGEVLGVVGFGESVQLRIRFESGEERELLARSLDLELVSRVASEAPASPSPAEETPAPEGRSEPQPGREATLQRDGFLAPRPAAIATPAASRPAGSPGALGSRSTSGGPAHPAGRSVSAAPLPSDPALRDALAQLAADLLGAAAIPEMDRWAGGELVLKPGRAGTKERSVPLDAFFHKIVMVRDRLRNLEQKISASPSLSDAEKVEMQQYLTRIQGSLTTFNFLFREREDWFVGQSGPE